MLRRRKDSISRMTGRVRWSAGIGDYLALRRPAPAPPREAGRLARLAQRRLRRLLPERPSVRRSLAPGSGRPCGPSPPRGRRRAPPLLPTCSSHLGPPRVQRLRPSERRRPTPRLVPRPLPSRPHAAVDRRNCTPRRVVAHVPHNPPPKPPGDGAWRHQEGRRDGLQQNAGLAYLISTASLDWRRLVGLCPGRLQIGQIPHDDDTSLLIDGQNCRAIECLDRVV
jgi:hypothetical protein